MSTQIVTASGGLQLSKILPDAKLIGAKSIGFNSCCGSWDECQPGDLYVAIVGQELDGHEFTRQALANGAVAIVTERLLAIPNPQCVVADTRQAYGKICHALAGNPSQRIKSIGVSGTDGKTVTSHLIKSILEVAESEAGISSSIEVSYGKNKASIPRSETIPPALAEHLSQMVISGCSHAVVEVPCADLAKHSFAGIDLDVAVITNIRYAKMDLHGTNENYRRSQARLLDLLKDTGLAVLNHDDPISNHLIEQANTPTLTFGMLQPSDVTGKLLDRQKSEQTFVLTAGSESIPVRTKMIGDQHIYNCLAAAAVGLSMGIELSVIAAGLEHGSSLAGRLERVECGQDFGVWVDSANSPNQLACAIRTIKQVVKGKVWCICSEDDRQTTPERIRIGEVVEKVADHVVITRTTVEPFNDYEPFHQFLDGFSKPEQAQLVPNRFKAIEWVLSQAKPEDGVLIAGCGERPFALVGEHQWTIGDRDVCQAWLYDHASLKPNFPGDRSQIFNIDDYRE